MQQSGTMRSVFPNHSAAAAQLAGLGTTPPSNTSASSGVDLAAVPDVAISPLDGRYRSTVAPLANYLSEAALNRARIVVEIEWLIALCNQVGIAGVASLDGVEVAYLRSIPLHFGASEIAELAELERTTVHDVKAVEYFIKHRLTPKYLTSGLGPDAGHSKLSRVSELVHFGCTSEDINNLAYALTIKAAVTEVWLPAAEALLAQLRDFARENAAVPMLSRTHGQAATPTTFGKEIAVFAARLARQLEHIANTEYLGKFSGATGTFGAHQVAAPELNWPDISRTFVTSLGLTWNPLTTQIEPHDWQSELYDDVARAGRIMHNLATDIWTYISLGYLTQEPVAGATGSSTMPHKINPIRFENAEANLEISNSLFALLSSTLTTSRLQRDLTDSTTQRNIGVAFGHSLLAIDNLRRGLAAVHPNPAAMLADLDANWEVLAEPIQTAMRVAAVSGAAGMENPYERLKNLTRGQQVTEAALRDFVAGLGLPQETAERLANLTPKEYVGLATELVAEHLG